MGNGDGTFTLKDSYFVPFDTLGTYISLATADFDRDGKLDIAISGTLLFGNGDGSFKGNSAQMNVSAGLVVADFNGDGFLDEAGLSLSGGNPLSIYLNDGTGNFVLAHTYPASINGTSRRISGDVNGDGKHDLIFFSQDQNQVNSAIVLLGNGDGSFGPPAVTTLGAVNSSQPLANVLADLNGDHKQDLALVDSSTNVNVFLSNGDGTFAPGVSYFAGSGALSVAAADFNSDKIADLAVTSGAGFGLLLGKGDGTFQAATFQNLPTSNPIIGVVADLNRDGKLDITAGGSTLLGNGDGTFTVIQGGGAGVLADINGDGILDLVDQGSDIAVSLGNGDGTFQQPTVIVRHGQKEGAYQVSFLGVGRFNTDTRPDLLVGAASSGFDLNTGNGGVVILKNVATPPSPDFVLTAITSTATVTAGQTASYSLSLTPIGGFNQSVSLSCSGNPASTTCTISPSSVTMNGTSAITATVTIKTTAATTGSVPPAEPPGPGANIHQRPFIFGVVALAVAMLFLASRAAAGNRPLRWTPLVALPASLLIAFAIASCGGGSSGGGGGGGTGTPSGTYTITISAAGGSTTHTTAVTLVVQ